MKTEKRIALLSSEVERLKRENLDLRETVKNERVHLLDKKEDNVKKREKETMSIISEYKNTISELKRKSNDLDALMREVRLIRKNCSTTLSDIHKFIE